VTGLADKARQVAFDTLIAVAQDEAYANLVLPHLLDAAGLSGRDAALATELGYGTLRATGTLDAILDRCSSRPVADIELGVLILLRLGSYQLLKTRIPSHAAVATTVDLARATGNGRAAGFVNAVLRRVCAQDFDAWCDLVGAQASPLGRLALRYSHPGWIVAAFAEALSIESGSELTELETALAADDERPSTHLVAWPGRVTAAELAEQSGGDLGPYSPYAVRLTSGGEPRSLPAIVEHRAAVQDEGSQLSALALAGIAIEGPDERWLDLCAGPGGKAALLAALAAERGARLSANELHEHRAELVARAVNGWDVQITVGDARALQADDRGIDRVLLDAPCTGLGALRRRPEARWRKSPADLDELVELQSDLLQVALRLIRPGGVVAYVTCSPHPAETTRQIQQLLADRPDVQLLDARPAFGSAASATEDRTVQLWPHRHGTDAMFFAALTRR
jgi:16S rRNA (cytosine967-C5)-methyltransferase